MQHLCLQSMKTVPILPAIMVLAIWMLPLSQTWSCRAFAPSVHQGFRKGQVESKQLDSCQKNERLVGPSSGIIVPFQPNPLTRHLLMANGSGGNFMDRVSRVTKSNVNQMASSNNLDSLEKGIVRAVEDLKVTVGRCAAGKCALCNVPKCNLKFVIFFRPIGNSFVKPMWKPGPVMVA
jgi:hypothetical protein